MKHITFYWQNINFVSISLWPVSLLYCIIIHIRKFCYKIGGLKPQKHHGVPVIVVGNISVGGNGKTPLIIYLLEQLQKKGYQPGVVSRGYGAINPQLTKATTKQVNINKPATLYGDEPWMIANKTHCPVVIGAQRALAVKHLISNFDCDIVLSDDGLQHYAMHRDIEICVVDSSKNFGNGFCLPAGPLREPIRRLNEVDFIVYHHTEKGANNLPIRLHKEALSTSNQQTIEMQLQFNQIVSMTDTPIAINFTDFIKAYKNQRIHAVAGIANPTRFFKQLKNHGINIIEHGFSDHHDFTAQDIQFNDGLTVIMTEKDAVKCSAFNPKNCYYLSVKTILSTDLVGSIINALQSKRK